jgi:Skp family chaperone for outer membrane proteins
MKKLAKELKSIKKSFIQLQKTNENESDSDISASDESQGDEQAESHFQFEAGNFQFAQVEHEFEPSIAKLFQQAYENTKTVRNDVKIAQALGTQLDLRKVILLDSQSTMDLFCNRALVQRTFRSDRSMRLKSNGGTMVVTKKAKMAGYHADAW